jgi:uncharacterized protein YndB with AHSA1/START domain
VTEIRVDVDLAHPPERVWRALTEVHLVMGWLPTANFLVTEDRRFSFRTELEGLDEQITGQVVTSERPNRLVMRWEGPNLHTLLSVTLRPTERGCRLSIAQRGFLGAQGTLRGRALQRTYAGLLEGPLVEALDRLATADPPPAPPPSRLDPPNRNAGRAFERLPRQFDGTPPRSNSAPGLTSHVRAAAGPRQPSGMPGFAAAVFNARAARDVGIVSVQQVAKLSRRRQFRSLVLGVWRRLRSVLALFGLFGRSAGRRSQAVAAAAALLLLLAMVTLVVGHATTAHPPHAPHTGGGSGEPLDATVPAQPRSTGGDPGHLPPPLPMAASATPSAPAPAGPSRAIASVLVATYKTERTRLSGYDASITIVNPSGSSVDSWSVTVTLPVLDLRIRNVDGAVAAATGQEVTFTPVDATRTVEPGAPVQLTFQVDGLGRPVSCAIDGKACVGLRE